MDSKPAASLSLDLDNLWSYLKIHGDAGWEQRPSYLDLFVPHVLGILDSLGLRITFFVVGVDAAQEANHPLLRSIVGAGHEIGNHSHEHESWLQTYSQPRLEEEIDRSQECIEAATGIVPTGFRGPGFSWSPLLLQILAARGFQFDASTLPTYLGPLARAYYFRTSQLTPEEKVARRELFGRFSDGFRPTSAYRWRLPGDTTLLEIPVTTTPVFKTPFHLSYLLYLSRVSPWIAELYLRTALALCRLTRTEPSFLLHPLDLIGGDQVPQLRFFPGMDLESSRKIDFFRRCLRILETRFEPLTMGQHAERLLEDRDLPFREPEN